MVSIKDLKKFRIFKNLSDNELSKIVEICHERTFGKGVICFSQGRKAMELHLCRSGEVDIFIEIRQGSGTEDITVHRAKAGDIFGWSALVEPRIYTASARCVEKTEDISIKGSYLTKLFEQNSHIGYVFMKNLNSIISARLEETRNRLSAEISTISRVK